MLQSLWLRVFLGQGRHDDDPLYLTMVFHPIETQRFLLSVFVAKVLK